MSRLWYNFTCRWTTVRARSILREYRFWMWYERLELTNGRGRLHARRLLVAPARGKTVLQQFFGGVLLHEFYPARILTHIWWNSTPAAACAGKVIIIEICPTRRLWSWKSQAQPKLILLVTKGIGRGLRRRLTWDTVVLNGTRYLMSLVFSHSVLMAYQAYFCSRIYNSLGTCFRFFYKKAKNLVASRKNVPSPSWNRSGIMSADSHILLQQQQRNKAGAAVAKSHGDETFHAAAVYTVYRRWYCCRPK